jgi:hypothetical protein
MSLWGRILSLFGYVPKVKDLKPLRDSTTGFRDKAKRWIDKQGNILSYRQGRELKLTGPKKTKVTLEKYAAERKAKPEYQVVTYYHDETGKVVSRSIFRTDRQFKNWMSRYGKTESDLGKGGVLTMEPIGNRQFFDPQKTETHGDFRHMRRREKRDHRKQAIAQGRIKPKKGPRKTRGR